MRSTLRIIRWLLVAAAPTAATSPRVNIARVPVKHLRSFSRIVLRRGIVYWLPLAILLATAFAHIVVPEEFDQVSALAAYDVYQRIAPREASPDVPVLIVDIDEHSLKQVGQWPWPRTVLAQLVDKLREAGAAVVAFDVLFSEADRTSPTMLMSLLTDRGVGEAEAKQLLSAMQDPDGRFAKAIADAPVVVGFSLSETSGKGNPVPKAGFSSVGQAGADPWRLVRSFSDAVSALPQFQKAASGNGFVNQISDWDNVVRRVPLLLRLGAKPFPSLAAEALRVGLGGSSYIGRYAGAQGEKSFGENTGLNAVKIGPMAVPTDAKGQVTVHYSQPVPRDRDPRYISAGRIIAGDFDPARIADRIVLVGSSAAGLNDLKATPVAPDMPGVEIHAQLIEQILQQYYLSRPDWGTGAEILFAVIVGIVLILAIPRIGALPSAFVAGVAMIIAGAVSWIAFSRGQMLIDPVYPIVVLGVVYLCGTLLNYRLTETRQREIREAFSRYMSPHYVDELARNPEKLKLGGEIKVISVMFCDIRGFTTLSEGLTSEQLGHLINEFLTPMTDIIMAHKGTIDKYIGDCIMAFWNAPLDDPDHAKNAVAAAQAMRLKLVELNEAWEAEGRPALHIGIGVNTGECSVGNFGSHQRFNYSLLGDPVNLSSRLEGLTKQYGVDLIIGEDSAALLDEPGLIELDLVAVKGKSRAVRIFTLPPHPVESQQYLARHAALLAAYRRRDWDAALNLLEDPVLAAERDMASLYGLFRERIAQLKVEGLPSDWDGVYVAHEK
jgi:adenylate cyclase